jgi:hypothetical protein
MSPMSSLALLLVSQFVTASMSLGPRIASIALPAILLMEVLGAILATFAIYRAGESSREPHGGLEGEPWMTPVLPDVTPPATRPTPCRRWSPSASRGR